MQFKINVIVLFIYLIPTDAFCQAGQWTWMNGDSTLYSNGNFGIQGVPDPNNSPPSLYECCEWKDLNGNFWIFGGDHLGMSYSDLWKFDPVLNIWTWMKGPGISGVPANFGTIGVPSINNLPQHRYRGALSWTDNNNNLWLYGSNGSNDLWKYEITSNQWTWMHGSQTATQLPVYGTLQIADSLNTPGDRWENSASWTDDQGNLWLFGGVGSDNSGNVPFYNDMWKYNVVTNEWTWMSGPNYRDDPGNYGTKGVFSTQSRPCARACYSRWKDTLNNFYIFGGDYTDYNTFFMKGLNDVWKYNTTTNQWAWIGGDSTRNSQGYYSPPCIRNNLNIPFNSWENRSTAFDINGNAWMFGGAGIIGNGLAIFTHLNNEFWHYDIYSNEWVLIDSMQSLFWGEKGIPDSKNHPSRKMGAVSWTDNQNNFWLFGGCDSFMTNVTYNAMWRYTPDFNCLTTGINDKKKFNKISVHPNPFNEYIYIIPEKENNLVAAILIYDLTGQIVFSSTSVPVNGTYQLNLQDISPGIYLMNFKRGSTNEFSKVIKN